MKSQQGNTPLADWRNYDQSPTEAEPSQISATEIDDEWANLARMSSLKWLEDND